ncbi:MAG: C39 family peptidase [Candidatus Yanofskybacteria bacterium]|nr:C39 family peptidase [Candidatus Yanofskybacteria bacterium]
MKEILIKLPICNQYDAEHDPKWAHRICAICSLWMLLKLYNPKFNISVMDLVKKGLAKDGYLENIGWKHETIVELANDFGLELQYAKNFFYTSKEKESGLLIVNRNLENGQPVLASVHRSRGGHMLVIHGFQESSGKVSGYFVQDPDGRVHGHNYFLTKQEFLSSWRGGLIYRH